jgi:P4 family phage/plasmid primase-like protien
MASYKDFLENQKTDDKSKITHTKIGDTKLGIYGGKYNITQAHKFNKLYYENVIKRASVEYLTEKQLDVGPILVDLDFRFETSLLERNCTSEHIVDLVELYLTKITQLFNIEADGLKFSVYVCQKPNIVLKDLFTKDGIHIVVCLNMDRISMKLLRENVLEDIEHVLGDLGLTNRYEDVLDDGICDGRTNWQLYGSRKPGCEAYQVTSKFCCKIIDGEIEINKDDHFEMSSEAFLEMSARNIKNTVLTVKEEYSDNYNKLKQTTNTPKNRKIKIRHMNTNITQIKNMAELDERIESFLEDIKLNTEDYILSETHQYTMCLGRDFYEPYNNWMKVGWALNNTSKSLFLTWIKFSSKSEKFSFDMIEALQEKWDAMNQDNSNNILTDRSIKYWALKENKELAEGIVTESISYYITEIVNSGGNAEYDIAYLLFNCYKDKFKCASVSKKIWYAYTEDKRYGSHGYWEELDGGTSLRLKISQFLSQEFVKKSKEITKQLDSIPTDSEDFDVEKVTKLRKLAGRYSDVGLSLKKTNTKNNIMRECLDLFYDRCFIEKLDENPYLLCFKNCVIDFKTNEIRKGEPEDYLSKCTGIEYIEYSQENPKHVKIRKEIVTFMQQLFPKEELYEYMWDHLASVLIGTNENQTFNMYTGVGRNGKSKLVELMEVCLGDYKGTVPITLITQKRTSIGSATPEIAQLKGTRYAVMQEPSKGQTLNEGIMKEITGGDKLQGRALYHDSICYTPQFTLAVCTNNLFNINSDDDGTWRRIRVCDFLSKFKEVPNPREESPYEYKIDKKVNEKFNDWKEIFMWMLVQRAFKTNGIVKECDMVMAKSNKYRNSQDHIAEFFHDCIEKEEGQRIMKTSALLKETFVNWYNNQYSGRPPHMTDLHKFLNKKIGEYDKGWHGYRIKSYDDIYGNNN